MLILSSILMLSSNLLLIQENSQNFKVTLPVISIAKTKIFITYLFAKWYAICEQQRHIVCASAQSDQHRCCSLSRQYILPIKIFKTSLSSAIKKTSLFKYIENFTSKNWKFSEKKKKNIFHISAQNIYCGTHNLCFWAEIRKIMYTPVDPSFTI